MELLVYGSTGPYVKLVQSILSRIGYIPGPVDGIYGFSTQKAVMKFQTDYGLKADGIVGERTWQYITPFAKGYNIYKVKRGDTLYDIARKFYTDINSIKTANPNIQPERLKIGQKITVPYGIDVVLDDVDYTYTIMQMDIEGLKTRYPFLQIGNIGNSVLGKQLSYIKLGKGPVEVFYNASHHALEWINSPMLLKFIENFSKAYSSGKKIRGYDVKEIYNKSTIYIVPMVNPDGVDVVTEGLSAADEYYVKIQKWNDTGFPVEQVWKANIKGVDLNLNYPAMWDRAKEAEKFFGVDGPAPVRYAGPEPLSEPESSALVDFTNNRDFKLVLAYHTQGRVIYWEFFNQQPPRAKTIGELFAKASGYSLESTLPLDSYAGYKDWFIKEYKKPGYTIETGIGKNPLPMSQFNTIYNNNEEILLLAPIV